MGWAKATEWWDENPLSFGFGLRLILEILRYIDALICWLQEKQTEQFVGGGAHISAWRHVMMTSSNGKISALLVLCAGNSPVPVNSPHRGQWRRALMFSLICAWINDWVNNHEAGDLRRHRGHFDVNVMCCDWNHAYVHIMTWESSMYCSSVKGIHQSLEPAVCDVTRQYQIM